MKNDHLFIDEIELPCRIGTTFKERAFPQILKISLKIELSLLNAGNSDRLTDTLDYAHLIEIIKKSITKRVFNLVEAVAQDVAEISLDYNRVNAVEVTIEKKVFAGIKGVGAFIRREKNRRSLLRRT